jgi:hypothetical protein
MANPAGESNAEVLRLDFDRRLGVAEGSPCFLPAFVDEGFAVLLLMFFGEGHRVSVFVRSFLNDRT